MEKETLLSIGRPRKVCMNCHQPIEKMDRHPSVLKQQDEKAVQRFDYCPECWQQMKDEVYESFWITHRMPPQPRQVKLNRREKSTALRALFESMWEQRDAEDVEAHLYLMAHLLMKWGGLKWLESETDAWGREVVIFEDPATADRIEVRATNIDDETSRSIQERIEQFLREYYASQDDFSLT